VKGKKKKQKATKNTPQYLLIIDDLEKLAVKVQEITIEAWQHIETRNS
jgi:hypothetical protein